MRSLRHCIVNVKSHCGLGLVWKFWTTIGCRQLPSSNFGDIMATKFLKSKLENCEEMDSYQYHKDVKAGCCISRSYYRILHIEGNHQNLSILLVIFLIQLAFFICLFSFFSEFFWSYVLLQFCINSLKSVDQSALIWSIFGDQSSK